MRDSWSTVDEQAEIIEISIIRIILFVLTTIFSIASWRYVEWFKNHRDSSKTLNFQHNPRQFVVSGARLRWPRSFQPIAKSSRVISKKILFVPHRGIVADCLQIALDRCVVWHGQVDVPGVRKMRDDLRHRLLRVCCVYGVHLGSPIIGCSHDPAHEYELNAVAPTLRFHDHTPAPIDLSKAAWSRFFVDLFKANGFVRSANHPRFL